MSTHVRPRVGSGQLRDDWHAKSGEILVKKPLHRRSWFRRTLLVLLLLGVTGGGVIGWIVYDWHREQLADLARQRRGIEIFIRSSEFAAFGREADDQLVAMINFAVARPLVVRNLWPAIAEHERAHRQLPWALELSPLPVSTAQDPYRVAAAVKQLDSLLVQRGFVPPETAPAEARRVFLRLLTPQILAFTQRAPEHAFPALALDANLQNLLLTAYAARSDSATPLADSERTFIFYAAIGREMWKEIEQIAKTVGP
jgi:hypothetical protein